MSKKNKHNQLLRQETHVSFSGPIPAPNVLESYERIAPGAAERIIKMAEQQSEHRIQLEKSVIHSNVKKSERGQTYGLIIGIFTIASAVVISVLGGDLESRILSGVIGVGGLTSLVSVFVYGKREARRERESRVKESES